MCGDRYKGDDVFWGDALSVGNGSYFFFSSMFLRENIEVLNSFGLELSKFRVLVYAVEISL